jgi:hypothetical protein
MDLHWFASSTSGVILSLLAEVELIRFCTWEEQMY